MRILHCPTTTGGNPQGLARAERRIGLESWSVAFTQNYIGYPTDEVLWEKGTPLWVQQWRCWQLLMRAWHHFDVIHYNAGTTILPWSFSTRRAFHGFPKWILYSAYSNTCRRIEKSLFRNKVIAVTFQGDDARQGDFSRQHFDISIAHYTGDSYYTPDSDKRTRQRIAWFSEYADLIYAVNPDLLWVLPKRARFVPYAHLDIMAWQPVIKSSVYVPVVVHAPTHRGVKGTSHILEAVNRLRSEGILFEFVLVENLSNIEARKIYERSDLAVDQLLAGWYGGFAVEVMALGKPVICYLRESDFKFIPPAMRSELPIISANPYNIYEVLREWLTVRRGELQARGHASRRYVERWHDPLRIAEEIKLDYERVAVKKGLLKP